MAFTPAEEARLRALMNQDASLLTLATNEPAIIQELGAQDVTIDELQLASQLLQTDKLLGRFGGEDKAVVLSVLSQFLKSQQGMGLGSAAYKNVGAGANQIPDMSSFSSSNSVQFIPGGWILQIVPVPSIPALGGLLVTYPTPFPKEALGIMTGSGAASPNVPGFNTQSIDKNSFKAWNQSPSAATQAGAVLAIGR